MISKKQLLIDFSWGPIIVCTSLLASYLRDLGYTDSDTVTRVVMCLSGLMVATFGNRVPQTLLAQTQVSVLRKLASKSLVLGGLIFAGLWAFAETSIAISGGITVLVLGFFTSLGHVIALIASASRSKSQWCALKVNRIYSWKIQIFYNLRATQKVAPLAPYCSACSVPRAM